MNEDLLQNDFLEQPENWLPAPLTESGEQQRDGLQRLDGSCPGEAEVRWSRNAGSHSSGNGCNGFESTGTDSRGSSVGNSRGPGRSKDDSSKNSELLTWSQDSEKLRRVIREMKRYLPAGKLESCGQTSTLSALHYALKCVRQVQTDSTVFDHGAPRASAGAYSIEELAAVASEHAPKDAGTFVAVFSLLSGKMVHVSEQAASILGCKKKWLDSARFVELLAPQDVAVFYTNTKQSQLPLWNMETQTASLFEYAQVKSFFCRAGGGRETEKRYCPFRITPYLVSVCLSDHDEPESCCLALAEKIHSGYEAPRIPLEKRIFTTTHTPGCVFLETDDRAVPLLGYLPQDLRGTSILMYLHPEDRPLMMAVHRKVLKFAGRPPFEHSPVRFCTRNGDYVVLDTSWSSFVNPWSRKVAFIVGRHTVRTSPLNEDVFAARSREMKGVDKEMWELQGQIYRLLLQPVHSYDSSGYGSLVSNGSYERHISVASSSDSSGNCMEEMHREPMTLQQVFVDVSRLKNVGQQPYIEPHSRPVAESERAPRAQLQGGKWRTAPILPCAASSDFAGDLFATPEDDLRSKHHILSYQQISCMESITRYLGSCSVPAFKRKGRYSANVSSASSSDDDKQAQLSRGEARVLQGSRNSSKYFASNDSSEVSKRGKRNREREGGAGVCQPARATEEVLEEDLEKLAAMANRQPRFTRGQEEELAEVHPWIRTQSIPPEIDTHGCVACESQSAGCKVTVPDDRDRQEDGGKDLLSCDVLPASAPT